MAKIPVCNNKGELVETIPVKVIFLQELFKQINRAKQYVELVAQDEVLDVLVIGLNEDLKEIQTVIDLLEIHLDLGVKYAKCA